MYDCDAGREHEWPLAARSVSAQNLRGDPEVAVGRPLGPGAAGRHRPDGRAVEEACARFNGDRLSDRPDDERDTPERARDTPVTARRTTSFRRRATFDSNGPRESAEVVVLEREYDHF
ncbi:hypothetical protein B0T42_09335 [Rathayibacter sp. VKM Ac-2630]|nr:hypothetical protein B0T42_09335 [Rathayibacter sp. VKM Ac-2630]